MKKPNKWWQFKNDQLASDAQRVIYINDGDQNARFKYAENHIKTTKYNLITFLPKNLYQQFRRVANFYFLVFLILTFIPFFTPFLPIVFVLPLATVIAFTAIKDAYDDWMRHVNDRVVNNRISYVLRNGA